MIRTTGARLLLDLLRQEGVTTIFGNPGTTELPLMAALAGQSELRYVLCLNEAVVMAAADGYAQATRGPVAVNLHAAPGLGNALGMLYDAQRAGTPVIVTAGQHEQGFCPTEPILWADLPRIAQPFVKWAYEVRSIEDLPRALHRAVKTALAPPTGPVFLSLPIDVLRAEAAADPGAPTRIGRGLRGDAATIATAAAILAGAERPLIVAGDTVAHAFAHAPLVALAELLGAPVYMEGLPTASFPTSHPLFRGALTRLPVSIRAVLQPHDALLAVGGEVFTHSLPGPVAAIPPALRLVQVDSDPWELGKNFPADAAVLGDPAAVLPDLLQAVAAAMGPAQRQAAAVRGAQNRADIATARAALQARARAEAAHVPIRPLALMQAVGEALPADAAVVEEALSSSREMWELIPVNDPQALFGMRGGGIGWGIAAAVGVKLALPARPVVALIGDGSSLYTVQALWTAARERAAVVFVILNNHSYRILKQRVHVLGGRADAPNAYLGMDLTDPAPDFLALARGFGVAAERAGDIPAFRAALARALEARAPALIDVEMDPTP